MRKIVWEKAVKEAAKTHPRLLSIFVNECMIPKKKEKKGKEKEVNQTRVEGKGIQCRMSKQLVQDDVIYEMGLRRQDEAESHQSPSPSPSSPESDQMKDIRQPSNSLLTASMLAELCCLFPSLMTRSRCLQHALALVHVSYA